MDNGGHAGSKQLRCIKLPTGYSTTDNSGNTTSIARMIRPRQIRGKLSTGISKFRNGARLQRIAPFLNCESKSRTSLEFWFCIRSLNVSEQYFNLNYSILIFLAVQTDCCSN